MSEQLLPIILASSSPYRQILMQQLGIPFTVQSPNINESAKTDETASELVQRLAYEKACAVKPLEPSWVIGADQVALCEGEILTKSHTFERAFEQLSKMSGKKVRFITGICLLNSGTQQFEVGVELVTLYLRQLSSQMIENYIQADKPFDCAASFKVESRGLALVKRFIGRDLNALVGLPMVRLVDMFAKEGVSLDSYWN